MHRWNSSRYERGHYNGRQSRYVAMRDLRGTSDGPMLDVNSNCARCREMLLVKFEARLAMISTVTVELWCLSGPPLARVNAVLNGLDSDGCPGGGRN